MQPWCNCFNKAHKSNRSQSKLGSHCFLNAVRLALLIDYCRQPIASRIQAGLSASRARSVETPNRVSYIDYRYCIFGGSLLRNSPWISSFAVH